MTPQEAQPEESVWSCVRCDLPLKTESVGVSYLGNTFPVDLLRCPNCGLTLVTEDTALGKMADVEKLLEDK